MGLPLPPSPPGVPLPPPSNSFSLPIPVFDFPVLRVHIYIRTTVFICSFRCESLLRRRGASGFGENEGRFDPADIFSFDYFFYLFGFALFPPLPLPLPPSEAS